MKSRLSLLPAALVLASAPVSADIVHLDDVIIDGSLCVGFDCVNGEAFGFDTIRLKENNVRIKFQDTSASASFPTNDWQLTANDSANGGQNKFSIDDIDGARTPFTIEASAPSHSLYVDDGGRIGFGTSTPVVELHVVDGDTPTLRLEQDGSSGFQAQTWDVAGNETNFFIRDATNGSTLPLRIRPGAKSNSIYIDTNSNVGIGDASPDAPLNIERSDGTAQLLIEETNATVAERRMLKLSNNGGSRIDWANTASGTTWKMNTNNSDQFVVSVLGAAAAGKYIMEEDASGNLEIGLGRNPNHPIHHSSGAHLTLGGVWTDASSRSLKKDIRKIEAEDAIQALHELEPVTFIYKSQQDERYAGFIAEEVPEIVAHNDRSSLSPMDFVAILTKVVKEQDKIIQSLEERLEKVEASR